MAILFECTEDEDDGIYSFQDMKVEVTGGTAGVPADFDDFVTFDRAGTAVLLEAEACGVNHTLDEQIRPVEDLAIQITFTLAGTSAGAGDTLDITGTDWRGAAQVESINVAAGNGAYTGAEYWRTITDIDCTGWGDGTLKVEQDRWGFIWDYGNGQYLIDAHFDIGDGGTSTYFQTVATQISQPDSCPRVTGNATMTVGEASNEYSGRPTSWNFKGLYDTRFLVQGGGAINFYNAHMNISGQRITFANGTVVMNRVSIYNPDPAFLEGPDFWVNITATLYDVYFYATLLRSEGATFTADKVHVEVGDDAGIDARTATHTDFTNLLLTNIVGALWGYVSKC